MVKRWRVHIDSLKLCHFLAGEEPDTWITNAGWDQETTTNFVEEEELATPEIFDEEAPTHGAAPAEVESEDTLRNLPDTEVRRSGRVTKPPIRLDL